MGNGSYSTYRLVTTGVPQGSALKSHQLFITFIRDMAAWGSSSRGQPWVLAGSELSQGQTCAWAATEVSSAQDGMSMARPMRTVAQAEHKRLRQEIRWSLFPGRLPSSAARAGGWTRDLPRCICHRLELTVKEYTLSLQWQRQLVLLSRSSLNPDFKSLSFPGTSVEVIYEAKI